MSEIVQATATQMLEGVQSFPSSGTMTIEEWLEYAKFQRTVAESAPGYTPAYRWDFQPDPGAAENLARVVEETTADGAWEAYKASDGFVNPSGSAAPNPTVNASPQTAIKGAGGTAAAGGLLSMSLPSWVAAAAPLLGVAIGVGLYELSPEFWTKVSKALLPWCYEGTQVMPVVTDENGNTYIDKEAVEKLKEIFEEEGIGQGGTEEAVPTDTISSYYGSSEPFPVDEGFSSFTQQLSSTISERYDQTATNGAKLFYVKSADNPYAYYRKWVCKVPFSVTTVIYRNGEFYRSGTSNATSATLSRTHETYYTLNSPPGLTQDNVEPKAYVHPLAGNTEFFADTILNGDTGGEEGYYPEGTSKWQGQEVDIDELPTKEVITDTTGTQTRDYIPVALPTTPGQSNTATSETSPTQNEDNETAIAPYIWPSISQEQYPTGSDTTGDDDQELDKSAPIPLPMPSPSPNTDPNANPSQPSDTPPQQIIDFFPPLDYGDAPLIPLPTPGDPTNVDGGVGGLVSVYNPTYAELQAFSQWLWVTYADASIDKIWNNPFDGVISLHELYATPNKGARKYIKSGFLVSPVDSLTIPNRYSEINCGTAVFPEKYGNYLDYSPYSKALCYLPFVGIVELNVDDIVGHTVNIRYRVDSYSGACIAIIECAKEGIDAVLYQFNGSCSVQMPISGGTQANIKAAQISAGAWQNAYHTAGVVGLAGGIAGGIGSLLTGNVGGAISGLVNGIGSMASQSAFGSANATSQTVSAKSSVQHSGQFGESYGAMGNKKPYMILKRPVQVVVPNYQDEYGYQAHKYVTIGECTGYLRCRGVHVKSSRATNTEKALIEQLLREGVYVTE